MLLAEKGLTDGYLTDDDAGGLLRRGLEPVKLDGQRVLALIPDDTRSCPLPMLFRRVVELLRPRAAKLDFLVALGTHQPMSEERLNRLVGITAHERTTTFADVGLLNHLWNEPGRFRKLGVIPGERIEQITAGLMRQDVHVGINRAIFDYDRLLILGPTFPHEVVGYSGGLKYLFPGIADWEFINFFHWLGAMITCINIIGTADTPVRQVINEAAKLVPLPITNIDLVVRGDRLAGLFIGDPIEAWASAAALSDKLHVVYKDRPYKTVLGVAPEMYEDIWTAGKVMYKLEPIVADSGELIIHAPHVTEFSHTHKEQLERIGYHVRDYFAKQMDMFRDVPGGVLAHSTHVRGLGTFVDGVEQPRIKVTLATQISKQRAEAAGLGWRDPNTIDLDSYRDREDEGILLVDHAGEVLHKLREPGKHITLPDGG